MGMSDRRKQQAAKRKAAKESRMKGQKPNSQSKYALKVRGQFSPASPYLTGNWGQRMRKLREQPPIQPTPHSKGWSAPTEPPLAYQPGVDVR